MSVTPSSAGLIARVMVMTGLLSVATVSTPTREPGWRSTEDCPTSSCAAKQRSSTEASLYDHHLALEVSQGLPAILCYKHNLTARYAVLAIMELEVWDQVKDHAWLKWTGIVRL